MGSWGRMLEMGAAVAMAGLAVLAWMGLTDPIEKRFTLVATAPEDQEAEGQDGAGDGTTQREEAKRLAEAVRNPTGMESSGGASGGFGEFTGLKIDIPTVKAGDGGAGAPGDRPDPNAGAGDVEEAWTADEVEAAWAEETKDARDARDARDAAATPAGENPATASNNADSGGVGQPPASTDIAGEAGEGGLLQVVAEGETVGDGGVSVPRPVAVEEEDPRGLFLQAARAVETNRFPEAEAFYQRGLALMPEAKSERIAFSGLLGRMGKHDEAVEQAKLLLERHPNDADGLERLGDAQLLFARYVQNVRIRLLTKEPEHPQGAQLLAMTQALCDDAKDAYRRLQTQHRTRAGAALLRQAHLAYFRATEVEAEDAVAYKRGLTRAVSLYHKAFEHGEKSYTTAFQIGVCCFRLENFDHAKKWLEYGIKLNRKDGGAVPKEAYFYLAMIHERLDEKTEAMDYWKEVATYYPPGSRFHRVAKEHLMLLRPVLDPVR